MKRILCTSLLILVAVQASADDGQGRDFGEIDAMLEKLESLGSQQAPVVELNYQNESELVDDVDKLVNPTSSNDDPIEAAIMNAQRPAGQTQGSRVLSTRVTELPPNTRFTFQKNLFIPAYKSGVMFVDGAPQYSIDGEVDVLDAFELIDGNSRACALVSNKSYLKINGGVQGGTYLEVSNISFKEVPWRDSSITVSRIKFKPKQARTTDDSVDIEIICRTQGGNIIRDYSLQDIDRGFGGIFGYQLPQYIEI